MKRMVVPKIAGSNKNENYSKKIYCNEENLCKESWIIGTNYKWIEIFFSVFTAVYFTVIFLFLSKRMDNTQLKNTFFWGVILTLLPFYRVRRVNVITSTKKRWFDLFSIRSFPFRAAISSMVLIIAISYLEDFVEPSLLVMYFAFTILFRMVDSRSLYEVLALCIAYSANMNGFVSENQRRFFASSRLMIWAFLLFGFVCGTILWRSAFRIWEHIRLLIIFNKKSKQERIFSNLIAAAHFSPDVLLSSPWKDEEVIRRDSLASNLLSDSIYPCSETHPCSETETQSNSIAEAAKANGILFTFDKNPILTIEKIRSLDGLERKLATVIAFKLVVNDERECCLNNQGGHAIHDLLDSIALRHNISCVRKFGDTWVGHIGFHKTWANSRTDSYHAILMGCEALVIAKKLQLRLCCAVESGKIDAGFIGCSNSDIFGPEIRWVLNMVEAAKNGDLLVGTSVRNLNTRKLDSLVAVIVQFERITINSIFKTSQDHEKVYCVSSPLGLVLDHDSLVQEFLAADLRIKPPLNSEGKETPPISWQAIQSILDDNNTKSVLKSASDRVIWNDELGCELQMSVEDRFGMSLDDAVLQSIPENELEHLHIQIEESVRSLMVKHFFGSCLKLLVLITPSKYRRGVNDQMLPLCSLKVAEESQEYLCPLEAMLRDATPFLYTLCAKKYTGSERQMNYTDTDEFLKDKIKKEALAHLTPNNSLRIGSHRSADNSIRSNASSMQSTKSTFISDSSRASCKPKGNSKAIVVRHRAGNRSVSVHPYAHDIESGQCDEEKDLESSASSLNKIRRPGVHIKPHISLNAPLTPALLQKPQDKVDYSLRGYFNHKKVSLESLKDDKHNNQLLNMDESPRVPSKLDVPGRGLAKYTSDTRNLEKNLIGFLFVIPAVCGNLLILLNEDTSQVNPTKALSNYYIFGLLATILFILNMFERKYDDFICVVTLIGRALLLIFTIPYLLQNGDPQGKDLLALPELALYMLALWFPIAVRQSFTFNCLEILVLVFIGLYVSISFPCHSVAVNFYAIYLLVMVFLLVILWTIEYLSIVSYVIENLLLPEAQCLYQREYVKAREMLHACSPSIPLDRASSLYCPRRYRNCSILAVHVKAADVLPGLVDVLTVASFMNEITLLIDTCIKECGLLKVTHFSGVFIAACPDLSDDNTPINHTTRTVICLRKIQTKLDAFSRRNSVNVSMGAGLTCGPVTMGLLGNSRFCFDMSGAARDLAVFMASHQNDGIFASEIFGPDIRNGQMSDDLVVRDVTVVSAHKTMKWLQLDGAFNKGMQLDDFDYMCMLGRGGFGSVHLLSENATEKEYAIKAIPRKTGSAIPKMIQREFIILQQIQHANVVSFKYCIINKNMIYLVMQYVRGGNLKQIVERNKPDLKHLTLWFAELVLALDYIHSLGIIHRDVKPANCMIDASGHLKLADFGLSKIVSPTFSSVSDPMGNVAEGHYRNAASTTAINLIKSILPLKSNMSEGEVNLPERSVQILLIDLNMMSNSAKRLREMYFKVTTVSTSHEARKALSKNLKAEIILVDLDSVNMSDPTQTMSSGLSLLRRLVMETSKNIPIIGLSSINDKDLTRKIINAGAKEVLTLPIHKSAREILLKNIRLYQHLKRSSLKGARITPTSPISLRTKKIERERTQSNSILPELEPEGVAAVSPILSSPCFTNTLSSHVTDATRTFSPSHHNLTSQLDENAEVHALRARNNSNLKQLEPRLGPTVSDGQQKHSAVGTIHFMAPEVIFERRYGRSVDWWACGVTFYECTMRQHLFSGLEKETIIQQILSAPIDLETLGEHSFLLQNLVAGLLVRDPKLRLGTEGGHTIMRHNFFKDIDWNTISESEPNYKPAQHVNQRHNVKDKMLFYGETEEKVAKVNPKEALEKYNQGSYKKGVVSHAATLNQTRKREKKVEMRNRKEVFQKLTPFRKRWVSGGHADEEADKKAPSPSKSKKEVAGSSFRGLSLSNSNWSGGRMSGASLDWSITMLKEEDDDEAMAVEKK